MKLNVYGQKIEIIRLKGQWKVFILGSEGKKRLADDIVIPSDIQEKQLIRYISDMFHERATPANNEVFEIS